MCISCAYGATVGEFQHRLCGFSRGHFHNLQLKNISAANSKNWKSVCDFSDTSGNPVTL